MKIAIHWEAPPFRQVLLQFTAGQDHVRISGDPGDGPRGRNWLQKHFQKPMEIVVLDASLNPDEGHTTTVEPLESELAFREAVARLSYHGWDTGPIPDTGG